MVRCIATMGARVHPGRQNFPENSYKGVWYAECERENEEVALVVKNLPATAGDTRDTGSFCELGRSFGGGQGNPLQYSCLENPTDRGVWWATVHGVAKSQTWLKLLSIHAHPLLCIYFGNLNCARAHLILWLRLFCDQFLFMLLYSCNSLESTKRLSGSKFPDYSQVLPPSFSPLFNHFAIDIYSLNIFCNMHLIPSSILRKKSEQSYAVSTLLTPRSSFHSELCWTLALYFHPLSGISTCMPQLCAPLNTYQTKQVIPHSLSAPPCLTCPSLLLLLSFCSLTSSPSSYYPSRIPGRHPLLHPCSSFPSSVEQQILPILLYHSSFRTPASGTESGNS